MWSQVSTLDIQVKNRERYHFINNDFDKIVRVQDLEPLPVH